MGDLNCPNSESWDPFCQRVQLELVDRLNLQDAVIHVHRHHGKNTSLVVNLSIFTEEKPVAGITQHQMESQIQVTMEHIKSIIEDLLKNCIVKFGEITFIVKRRLLQNIVFSHSKRPNESTECFFVINI